ncbi:MAG: LacI family DNA-binding transcriptional regulator, partial [Blautia massiliensis (ex Durand et al. 2017)]
MTIRDIAREAGYAVGTVSRVLNNNPNVSAAARARILEVVQQHNFQPNANARHLKLQSSSAIAILVRGTQNMLFTGILEKMQALIEERGYVSLLYYVDEEADELEQARRVCQERRPYG